MPAFNATYERVSMHTADDLRTIARAEMVRDVSHLSLPEVDAISELVGRIIPAGNIPGVILSGLAQLPGRKPAANEVRRDVNLIFRGVEQMLDRSVYNAFFAGPAAVIWGYQNLLKLAGKDPLQSFPEGTWQFYVDYALREDTARHTNETSGFDTALSMHGIKLPAVDRITAWMMTAIHILYQYPRLLANEWRERVYIRLLQELTRDQDGQSPYDRLYGKWERERPYQRGHDVTATDDYPAYRAIKFEQFLREATAELSPDIREQWYDAIDEATREDLPAYLRQMSIVGYLNPDNYGEKRIELPLASCHIGLIKDGYYYLLPVTENNTNQPVDVLYIRDQIQSVLEQRPHHASVSLIPLVEIKRTELARFRERSSDTMRRVFEMLETCPILINVDAHRSVGPLAEVRQVERGIGSHALTILDTGHHFVFDQSHIYFDGAWGSALAEIMTNEALSWAVYLHQISPAEHHAPAPYSLRVELTSDDIGFLRKASHITPEVSAENQGINIKAILALRKIFKQRSDLLNLTVNDILLLYRAIHATTYTPSETLLQAIEYVEDRAVREQTLQSLRDQSNPAILIPVDASQRSPRDRLYPMSFTVPLKELDLLRLHEETIDALNQYERSPTDRQVHYERFDQRQREYLATLAGFGDVMTRAKIVALQGESASVGTIKLLAHMPTGLQRLLDDIPGRFEVLNDIIKGREVFSNVGAVARTSTLSRFITAKDDNEKKTLAWGVITTADGVMNISLRDFRPHVQLLLETGHADLARRIVQDYLEIYVQGLNSYISEVRRVTIASRQTRLQSPNL